MYTHKMLRTAVGAAVMMLGASYIPQAEAADLLPESAEGKPQQLITDFEFTEGPLWLPEAETLIFSDIPADTIYDEDRRVIRRPSGQSNGLTLDHEGRLIACEHANRRVTRTEADGSITVLAEHYDGKRLNSPNDVVVRADGMIFFTDPPYGLEGGLEGPNAELDFSGVYALMPGEELILLADDFKRPNGLTLSPDGSTLYVADTAENHIRAFDVAYDGSLSNGRIHYPLPNPDGIKRDTEGRVWATAGDGVHVISPAGEQEAVIAIPEVPANLCFGGSDGSTLYVTARNSVYTVKTLVEGIRPMSEAVFPIPNDTE